MKFTLAYVLVLKFFLTFKYLHHIRVFRIINLHGLECITHTMSKPTLCGWDGDGRTFLGVRGKHQGEW